MISENLESAKYLELTEAEREYDRKAHRLRRQEHLIGDRSELKKLCLIIAAFAACFWVYSSLRGSMNRVIQPTLKAKGTMESMAGELNQEKKVWDFIDI